MAGARWSNSAWIVRTVLAAAMLVAAACTVANGVNVCERPGWLSHEAQSRFDGSQSTRSADALVPMPNGRAMVFFTSDYSGTHAHEEIRGTRIATDGTLHTCDVDGAFTYVAADPAGPVLERDYASAAPPAREQEQGLVAYVERDQSSATANVFVVSFSGGNGCPDTVAEPLRISDEPPGAIVAKPSVVRTGVDEFVVLWTSDTSSDTSFERRIRARALFVGGVTPELLRLEEPTTGEVTSMRPVTVSPPGDYPLFVDATLAGPDRLAVTWTNARLSGPWTLRVGIYDGGLGPVVGPFDLGTAERNDSNVPQIAFDGGRLLAVWGNEIDGTRRVLGRFVTPSGDFLRTALAPDGGAFRVAHVNRGDEGLPAVAPRSEGGFLVAWTRLPGESSGSSTSERIFLTAFDGDGARQFLNPACDRSELELTPREAGSSFRPALAVLEDATVGIAWTDRGESRAGNPEPFVRAAFPRPRDLFPVE